MNEPRRLRDDQGQVGQLLRQAPRPRPLSAEARERSAVKVARMAALPAAAGVVFWLKGAAALAGGTVTLLAIHQLATRPEPAPTRVEASVVAPAARLPAASSAVLSPASASAAPAASIPRLEPVASLAVRPAVPPRPVVIDGAASEPAASAVAPREAPASSASAVASASPSAAPPPPSAAPPADALLEEMSLLEPARRALASNPTEALARLNEHAARFPRGKMSVERELMTVDALRRLGRTAEARTRCEALLRQVQGGLYEERVRTLWEQLR